MCGCEGVLVLPGLFRVLELARREDRKLVAGALSDASWRHECPRGQGLQCMYDIVSGIALTASRCLCRARHRWQGRCNILTALSQDDTHVPG